MTTTHSKKRPRDAAANAARYAYAGLFLTSAHHAYGAHVYGTPWRYHVLFITGGAALVMAGALAAARRYSRGFIGALARGGFGLTTLTVPVLMFGVFEGLYSHVLKDVLYFAGASPELMTHLFPPPRYEMPNDAIFEVTGVLQVVPAVLTVVHLYRMIRSRAPATPSYAAVAS